MSTALLACEVGLWLVFFILFLLAVRAVMKAFCPNRAVFRSGNDVKRKRQDEEESSEEMMKPEKTQVIVNGQSESQTSRNGAASTTTTTTHCDDVEWESQTTAATRNAPPRPTPVLKAGPEREAGEGGGGDTEEEEELGMGRRRRRCCAEPPQKPNRRKALEALFVTLLTIILAYFVMMGAFALVYYLFEHDFLYSDAVPCPAHATEECEKSIGGEAQKVPCCDYSFDVEGLRREERFLGVVGGGGGGVGELVLARVHMWIVHAHADGEFYDAKRPKYLVYTHGNIDNLSFDKRLYEWLAKDLGINVVAWDYPGFGKSTGNPTEETLHRSMQAVFQWLEDEKKARRADIILWGYSLGGPVAARAANRFPGIMGLILQAPMDSVLSVASSILPLSGWGFSSAITEKFDISADMEKLRSCLFLFVGKNDTQFTPARMRRLYDMAQRTNPSCRKFVEIPLLQHLSDPLDSPLFLHQLRLFLNKIINMTN